VPVDWEKAVQDATSAATAVMTGSPATLVPSGKSPTQPQKDEGATKEKEQDSTPATPGPEGELASHPAVGTEPVGEAGPGGDLAVRPGTNNENVSEHPAQWETLASGHGTALIPQRHPESCSLRSARLARRHEGGPLKAPRAQGGGPVLPWKLPVPRSRRSSSSRRSRSRSREESTGA